MTQPRILVVFQTTEGQTGKITDRIAEELRGLDCNVEVHAADSAPSPAGFDAAVIGGSIHTGKYGAALVEFITANVAELNGMKTALFQVSLTSANPDERHTAEAHGMMEDLLTSTGFDPDLVAMFAGAVVYTKYGWVKRRIMRSIVAAEGGDTDTTHDHEYTDWDAVVQFARDVKHLAAAPPH